MGLEMATLVVLDLANSTVLLPEARVALHPVRGPGAPASQAPVREVKANKAVLVREAKTNQTVLDQEAKAIQATVLHGLGLHLLLRPEKDHLRLNVMVQRADLNGRLESMLLFIYVNKWGVIDVQI